MPTTEEIINEKAKKIVEGEIEPIEGEVSKKETQSQVPTLQINGEKTLEEQAKDLVGVKATERAINDEILTDGVTNRKKAELLSHAEAHLKKEQAENKKADILLQEANHGVYDGVATYAGIKKALPQKMQSVLFPILSAVQIIVLILIGVPISIVNIVLDSVDSVVQKMQNVTRSARWIVLGLIIFGIFWVAFLIIKQILLQRGIFL